LGKVESLKNEGRNVKGGKMCHENWGNWSKKNFESQEENNKATQANGKKQGMEPRRLNKGKGQVKPQGKKDHASCTKIALLHIGKPTTSPVKLPEKKRGGWGEEARSLAPLGYASDREMPESFNCREGGTKGWGGG